MVLKDSTAYNIELGLKNIPRPFYFVVTAFIYATININILQEA